MRTKRVLFIAGGALAAILLQIAPARFHAQAQTASALSGGEITSAEEGPMGRRRGQREEGRLHDDQHRRYQQRCGPLWLFLPRDSSRGHYTLKARAASYELDGAVAPAGCRLRPGKPRADIKLKKAEYLSAQLTNAEWLMSIPGTEKQKQFLLNCNGCHTYERIMKSSYDADEFMEVIHRMSYCILSRQPRH